MGRVFAEDSLTKIAAADACLAAVRVALLALEARIESDRDQEIVSCAQFILTYTNTPYQRQSPFQAFPGGWRLKAMR